MEAPDVFLSEKRNSRTSLVVQRLRLQEGVGVMLPLQEAQVQSSVGKLRLHRPCCMAQKGIRIK